MWAWGLAGDVKSIAGFSTVLKKDPSKQRKILMACAANYWWSDARSRRALGMHGGGALAPLHVESGTW